MNSSPADNGAANQTAPSSASPSPSSSQPNHETLSATSSAAAHAPPVKRPSSKHPTTAIDHYCYNKQLPANLNPQNPPRPNPDLQLNLQLQLQNPPPHGLMYPVGASIAPAQHHHLRPGGVAPPDRSCTAACLLAPPASRHSPVWGGHSSDVLNSHQMHLLKSGYLLPVGAPPPQGFPVTSYPKVAFSPAKASDRNGIRESRGRCKDEAFASVLNRIVRVSEGSSLYALCRSWMKNGCHEQSQPKHATRYSSLPRPLPTPSDTPMPKTNGAADDDDKDQLDEKSVDQLSSENLLQRHIKRAKRVRSRLREERLQRIARYKLRLGTLLPSPLEPMKDDIVVDH